MVAELHTEAQTSDQVDDEDCVVLDWVAAKDLVEHPHAAHELEEDQEDAERDEERNLDRAQDLLGKKIRLEKFEYLPRLRKILLSGPS